MIVVLQRVSSSQVSVEGNVVGSIDKGFNILLGVVKGDTEEHADKLIDKIMNLRVFGDENDKMNLSLLDIEGEVLVISQFTLAGNCKKGRRPSFDTAASPQDGELLYKYFVQKLKEKNIKVQTGEFGAMMDVEIHNDGPVTFVLDSEKL